MANCLDRAACSLRLLDRFEFIAACCEPRLGFAGQRLLALLALRQQGLDRRLVVRELYPEIPPQRAARSLRTTLWRIQRCCPAMVKVTPAEIRLAPEVTIDLHAAVHTAELLLDQSVRMSTSELGAAIHARLTVDLLPDWPDDWLVLERERFRMLRLDALEALCGRLTAIGWYGAAIDAGLAALAADPLRESAHCMLIKAHLAEGNLCEARRQAQQCQQLMRGELGLDPALDLLALLRGA
jgi:DNA-binding SARP family transcriptional activator